MASSASFSPPGNKEQGGDEWNVVMKVKYGDTLKRFSAHVHRHANLGQQQMIIEYDMNQLRAKISNFFNFNHDSVLVLTYTDEDGDIVSLETDDELRDAVITQKLNPLKINVHIKSFPAGGSHSSSKPDESSDIRAVSAGFPQLATKLNDAVDKSLKSLPEPIRGSLSNISQEILQFALSAPGLSDLLPLLSILSQSQSSNNPTQPSTGMSTGVPSTDVHLNTSVEPKVSDNSENQILTAFPRTDFVTTVTENISEMCESGNSNEQLGSINRSSDALSKGKSPMADLLPSTLFSTHSSNPIDAVSNGWPSTVECPFSFTPLDFPTSQGEMLGNSSASATAISCPLNTVIPSPISCWPSQSDASGSRNDFPTLFPCPPMLIHPYRRPPNCHFHPPRTFHQGVICDGCGMHPIVGPRYKSTVKENYDLCATCFRDIGTEAEYTRIDSSFRFPKLKDHQKHHHRSRAFPKIMSHNRMKVRAPKGPKLESSFVVDVTVWDGTCVRPNSRFTKIWRMCNTGTIAWPSGTRLEWVGGYILGIHTIVELEIPVMGFPVYKELDIAVDCIAPTKLGKYISYWQMVSPFGQKFGEEVWIIIEVCDPEAASSGSIPTTLNLNLPPGNTVIVDIAAMPLGFFPSNTDESLGELLQPAAPYLPSSSPADVTSVPQPSDNNPASSSMEIQASLPPKSNPSPIDIPAASSPISYRELLKPAAPSLSNSLPADVTSVPQPSDNSLAPSSLEIQASLPPNLNPSPADIPAASSPISYPLVDISALPNSLDIDYAPPDTLTDEDMVELTLLKELAKMGFTQTDLNKDVLRQNQYNLEQSIEELCEFAEWDSLLKELQEMGFNDRHLNKNLLSKNAGSIKQVVLELISREGLLD